MYYEFDDTKDTTENEPVMSSKNQIAKCFIRYVKSPEVPLPNSLRFGYMINPASADGYYKFVHVELLALAQTCDETEETMLRRLQDAINENVTGHLVAYSKDKYEFHDHKSMQTYLKDKYVFMCSARRNANVDKAAGFIYVSAKLIPRVAPSPDTDTRPIVQEKFIADVLHTCESMDATRRKNVMMSLVAELCEKICA